MKEWLKLEVIREKPKTKVYSVTSTYDKSQLGIIEWFPPWRQYVFKPVMKYKTIWTDECLIQLVNFLQKLKKERRIYRG